MSAVARPAGSSSNDAGTGLELLPLRLLFQCLARGMVCLAAEQLYACARGGLACAQLLSSIKPWLCSYVNDLIKEIGPGSPHKTLSRCAAAAAAVPECGTSCCCLAVLGLLALCRSRRLLPCMRLFARLGRP